MLNQLKNIEFEISTLKREAKEHLGAGKALISSVLRIPFKGTAVANIKQGL